MKKSVRILYKYWFIPLLLAEFCLWAVWRGKRQREVNKALIDAVQAGNATAAAYALQQGADPNVREIPDIPRAPQKRFEDMFHHTGQQDEQFFPVLFCATLGAPEHFALVKALLDASADPNKIIIDSQNSGSHYETTLISAENHRYYDEAHLLLEHHADIEGRGYNDLTPLIIAIASNDYAEIEYLIQHGANSRAQDKNGTGALSYAAAYAANSIILYLIQHGADVNHRSKDGFTALHYARKHKRIAAEKLLLKVGAVE